METNQDKAQETAPKPKQPPGFRRFKTLLEKIVSAPPLEKGASGTARVSQWKLRPFETGLYTVVLIAQNPKSALQDTTQRRETGFPAPS